MPGQHDNYLRNRRPLLRGLSHWVDVNRGLVFLHVPRQFVPRLWCNRMRGLPDWRHVLCRVASASITYPNASCVTTSDGTTNYARSQQFVCTSASSARITDITGSTTCDINAAGS